MAGDNLYVPDTEAQVNILSVLVADLVLLQTIWEIFVLSVHGFLVFSKKLLNHCDGHAINLKEVGKSDSEAVVNSRARDAKSLTG